MNGQVVLALRELSVPQGDDRAGMQFHFSAHRTIMDVCAGRFGTLRRRSCSHALWPHVCFPITSGKDTARFMFEYFKASIMIT